MTFVRYSAFACAAASALYFAPFVATAQPASADRDDDEPEASLESEGRTVVVREKLTPETPLADKVISAEVITRKDIEASGADSLAELLADQPGFDITPGFRGSSMRVRGLEPDHLLLLVDGARTIGRIDGAIDLDRYSLDDVERIEIVKGASSARYGSDALAGVINIVTRRAKRPLGVDGRIFYKSRNEIDSSVTAEGKRGCFAGRLSSGYHRGDGFDLSPDTVGTTASGYEETSGSGRVGCDVSNRINLAATADLLRRDLQGVDGSPTGAITDRQSLTEELAVALELNVKSRTDERNKLQAVGRYALFRDQIFLDVRNSTENDLFQKTKQELGTLKVTGSYQIGEHLVSAGAELYAERLSADRLSRTGSRTRAAVFVEDKWMPLPGINFTMIPGVRANTDSQFGQNVLPKLALRYDPSENDILRASMGFGFRAPNFRELLLFFENPGVGYVVQGNQDLQPEYSQSVDASYDRKWTHWLATSVSVFYNEITDLITIDLSNAGEEGAPQLFSYTNVSSAFTRGGQALVTLSPLKQFRCDIGYSLADTRDRSTNRALPGRARNQGTINARYFIGDFGAGIRGNLVGKRRFYQDTDGDDEVETLSTDPVFALDFKVSYKFMSGLDAQLGADNLFNMGNDELAPVIPRTYYAGLRARY